MQGPTKWVAAAAVAAAVLFGGAGSVSAQGAGGGGGQQGPQDPPVVAYRKAMMNSFSRHQAALNALVRGQVGLSAEAQRRHVEEHADALEEMSKLASDIFPEGSTAETSRAMAEIWTKKDEFSARVKALQDAADAVEDAADDGDMAATQTALTALGQTCAACHQAFRKPAPQPAR